MVQNFIRNKLAKITTPTAAETAGRYEKITKPNPVVFV